MSQGTTEKRCTQCGGTFRSGTNLLCTQCRNKERECVTCGKTYRGRDRKCYECRANDHPCTACGEIFHGTRRICERCRKQSGTCQMPDCTEPKLRGRGHKYCTQHYAEGPRRESAQVARRSRERRFGVTHDQFLAMLAEQGDVCAICGNGNVNDRQLSIDHDHVTGAVRGLLCDRCNPLLGYARDNIAVLEMAIEYLRRYSN